MTNAPIEIPPEVLRALETLETGATPTDLGPAYSILLQWKAPRLNQKIRLGPFRPLTLFPALIWPLSTLSRQPDWFQGFACAYATLAVAQFLETLLGPAFARHDDAHARVRRALDKWRHLVPAMREIPR